MYVLLHVLSVFPYQPQFCLGFFLKYLLYAVLGEMYYCFYICDGDVFIIVERGGRC